jgi:hypothetical protein
MDEEVAYDMRSGPLHDAVTPLALQAASRFGLVTATITGDRAASHPALFSIDAGTMSLSMLHAGMVNP